MGRKCGRVDRDSGDIQVTRRGNIQRIRMMTGSSGSGKIRTRRGRGAGKWAGESHGAGENHGASENHGAEGRTTGHLENHGAKGSTTGHLENAAGRMTTPPAFDHLYKCTTLHACQWTSK